MWDGYATYNGTEIINAERTARYAHSDAAHWFKDTIKADTLALNLGHLPYRTPLQDGSDGAPWFDPDVPEGKGFYGFWPLEISGVDDSSRTSVITENIGDGGVAGRLRHGTKQMVFTGLLLGRSEASVEVGMAWLRNVLLPRQSDCNDTGTCDGAELSFFSAEPPFEEGRSDCADPFWRTMKQVVVGIGPTILSKNVLTDGSAVWRVSFTAVAGIPWQFGLSSPVVEQFPRAPARGGVYEANTEPDLAGRTIPETHCGQRSYTPVFDPRCPDLVLPPQPPAVPLGCFNPPLSWKRYSFNIPKRYIPIWTDVVPVITVHTGTEPLRNLRFRLYVDPDGTLDPDDTPCKHCVDMLVSFCPEDSEMVIDGQDQTVNVLTGGRWRRADGLVFDTDGLPFTWPNLTGGHGYVATVDMLLTAPTGMLSRTTLDLSLVPRIR